MRADVLRRIEVRVCRDMRGESASRPGRRPRRPVARRIVPAERELFVEESESPTPRRAHFPLAEQSAHAAATDSA